MTTLELQALSAPTDAPAGYPAREPKRVTFTLETRQVRGPVYYPVAPDTVAVVWDEMGLKLAETQRYPTDREAMQAARRLIKRRGWVLR